MSSRPSRPSRSSRPSRPSRSSRPGRSGRRILLASSLSAVLCGLVAGPADAAAPTRIDAEYWSVDCAYALEGGDTLFLFASGTTDGAEGGVGAFVESAEGEVVGEGFTEQFSFGDAFTASLAVGEADLDLDLGLTAGQTVTEPLRERSGNSWTKGTASTTDLRVDVATLSYGGVAVDPSGGGCGAQILGFDVLTTNPSASVYRDRDFSSEICAVDGIADAEVRLSGALPDLYAEVVADHGDSVEKLQGDLPLHGRQGSFDGEVVDLMTGETTTTGSVEVALTRLGHQVREVEGSDGFVERRTSTAYLADVAVVLADGRTGTATCAGVATDTHVWVGPHAGQ